MSPLKFSLTRPGNDQPEEELELDDELVDRLRAVVDATPDLTFGDAVRRGLEHVVDNPPPPRVPPGR